jgi:hypothetical protein
VITTLLDARRYPAAEVAGLYARRWEVETLKQTLDLGHLRCKSVTGARKELLARSPAYDLVRATMKRATAQLGTDLTRVSFADALHWPLLAAGPGGGPRHITVNLPRPGHSEPGRVRARNTNYLPLNCSRADARRKVG